MTVVLTFSLWFNFDANKVSFGHKQTVATASTRHTQNRPITLWRW